MYFKIKDAFVFGILKQQAKERALKQAGAAAELMESIERNGRFCYSTQAAPLRPPADYPREVFCHS